jgi:uncharacterized protein
MTEASAPLESQVAPPGPVAEKPTSEESRRRPRHIGRLIVLVQSILLLAHGFLYGTWISFHPALAPASRVFLQIAVPVAAVSFVAATTLAWRSFNWLVRIFYLISAVWVGFATLGLFAAALCWILLGIVRLSGSHIALNQIADVLFAGAILIVLYGIANAARLRVSRIPIKLPNLPVPWRGRTAALVSDMHLGHVRSAGFMRRIVARLNQLRPDIVFIAGDMYDGTRVDADALAEPWSALSVPLGALFVTGNHEEFTSRAKYLEAVSSAGIRVLNNEKIEIQGLLVLGVHYRETVDPRRFRAILQTARVAPQKPSILLVHAPHGLPIAEEAGISLQLCGHTHGGQFPPASWITSRIYGTYVHGLNRFGRMLVLTSWGVGTWGPPLRIGTSPEILLLTFEPEGAVDSVD